MRGERFEGGMRLWGLGSLLSLLMLLLVACGDDDAAGQPLIDEGEDVAPVADAGADPDTGGPSDAGSYVPPDVDFPRAIARVDTTLLSSSVRAGDIVHVTCQLFDELGVEVEAPEALRFDVLEAPTSSFEWEGGDLIAVRAGSTTVRCAAAALGLVDETPEALEIIPGRPERTVIAVDRHTITAGESVEATCTVYDARGNRIDDAQPELEMTPVGDGVAVEGLRATIERADIYTLSCDLPGVPVEQPVDIEVVPDLPVSLLIDVIPNQPVYAVGQVVTISWIVTDSYGNLIFSAPVTVTSAPEALTYGNGRFRFDAEGIYLVTARVPTPTASGVDLVASTQIVVNSTGPAIDCASPLDGSMLDVTPGQPVTITGAVSDVNGVDSVTVNGTGATLAVDGTFSATTTARWGVNFVDIIAEDIYGAKNSRTCAFLASEHWSPQSAFLPDAVLLKLRQPAIDDANAADFDSLDDLLERVLNSAGLRDTLHTALLGANPLKPMSCDAKVLFCVFKSEVIYLDNRIDGPNASSLTLISDGLNATATIRNVAVKVEVNGTVDTTGWAKFEHVRVDLDLDLYMQNGRPAAKVRGVNSVDVGRVDLDFPGFSGLIIDILQALFQGAIRDMIRDQIRDYVTSSFDAVVDGLVSSLDVDSLGSTFSAPRLGGGPAVDLGFGLTFSSLDVSSARALFGIGTRFSGPSLQAKPSLGVPRATASAYVDPAISGAVAVPVYVGVLNQALHALWRAAYFDAVIQGASLSSSFPAGTTATLQTDLPPVVESLGNGRVRLMLGAAHLALFYPGVFDTPLDVTLGAVASTSVSLQGEELSFGPVTIDELVFSTREVSLDPTTRALLESFLTSLVQSIVDTSLNGALPALPIPSFEIAQSLGVYGLPVGQRLGLLNPTLSHTTNHFLLTGGFGLLP